MHSLCVVPWRVHCCMFLENFGNFGVYAVGDDLGRAWVPELGRRSPAMLMGTPRTQRAITRFSQNNGDRVNVHHKQDEFFTESIMNPQSRPFTPKESKAI